MQFDIFGDPEPVDALPAADIEAPSEKPPCAPMPTAKPQLDAWTRTTQRLHLLYLIGAITRGIYRDSSEANAPYILAKLNGLGGEW